MSELTGTVGKLKVGYQVALTIGPWTVVRQQPTLGLPEVTLTGTVVRADGYWSRQRPMVVGLWMGETWWVWTTLTEIEGIEAGTISARLTGDPVAVREF